jgi:putative radical SAM enzyme (TIGR03279 family)
MRESCYFKDDDSRLSFLHGNYVTLTNISEREVERIIEMHISPINVSVHTTDPELRCKMLSNRFAGEKLSYLRRFADAGITICAQIVLCRGINDGAHLDRTLHDLMEYLPALDSVSIVPAGLTKYRENLPKLELFSPEECRAVIKQVAAYGDWCMQKYSTRVFLCSDEFYVRGGIPLPDEDFYCGFSQLEDGVGMLTSFKADALRELLDGRRE